MNQYQYFNVLAAATALALVTTGASAAGRADLHREDMARVKQSNAAIAASGAVNMAHSRHEQALGLDADSRLFLLDRKTSQGVRNAMKKAPDSDKLRIEMAVLGLGQYALGSGDIGEMVLPEMTQIAKLSGAAVSLGIVDQDDILIVKRAQGDGQLLMNLSVGSRLPIATSSAGWAYLAGLPTAAREEALQKLKYQVTGKWTALRAAVEAAAANLATNGFVFNEGFYHPDVNAVGSPAFDKSGKPQYVVTCGGPNLKAKFMRDEIGPRLARLSRKITVALAARGFLKFAARIYYPQNCTSVGLAQECGGRPT